MEDLKQKVVGGIKIVSQSKQTPDEFMEELKSTVAEAMGTDGFEVSIVDLQGVIQTPLDKSLLEKVRKVQKVLDKIKEKKASEADLIDLMGGKKFYSKRHDGGEQDVDIELMVRSKDTSNARTTVIEKIKSRDLEDIKIECDNCNNDISPLIEHKPYNHRVICPYCYTMLDVEYIVNVDSEGTFQEHQYWLTWKTESNIVDLILDDIKYFTVNGSRDLGMTHRELIGKKVGFIKILKSGLYSILDMEEKKAYSIPKYNLDPIEEEQ